jgi:hypothetical protein
MSYAASDSRVVALSTAPRAQTSAATIAGFDYAALPPADAEDLRNRAGRLRCLFKKHTEDILVIGRDLIAVKERLAHGHFESWIERELRVGIRAAQNYTAVAKFAEGKSEQIALLPPSTLRILAAKSAPPEIIEQVIARAGAGDIVPDDAVREMIRTERTAKGLARRKQAEETVEAKRKSNRSKAAKEARAKMAAAEEVLRAAAQEQKEAKLRAAATETKQSSII